MAVQLRSGKEVGNNSKNERKEGTEEEQEETGKEEKKNMPERLQKQGNKHKLNSLREAVRINIKKKHKLTHLQCHFLRGFRKQGGKSSFLNS